MPDKSTIARSFQEGGWALLEGLVSASVCSLVARYVLMKAETDPNKEGDSQVPGSHSAYGDALVESLADLLCADVEKIVGESLWPTYGYFRLYKHGDALKPHTDRTSCDVSLTICLGCEFGDAGGKDRNWPIWMRPLDSEGEVDKAGGTETEIKMNPGDAALYKGCDLTHWREPFQGVWQAQAFLHYVRKAAPYGEIAKYDGRPGLGRPAETRDPDRAAKIERIDKFARWVIDKKSK